MKIVSNEPAYTYDLGKKMAVLLPSGAVLGLKGDLGAGKTLFVQGLAAGLNVADEVTSPTFSLMNIYEGSKTLYHFDLYRLDFAEQLQDIGFYEYSMPEEGVAVIEWPDKFMAEMPDDCIYIEINRGSSDNERELTFRLVGNKFNKMFEELKNIADFSD